MEKKPDSNVVDIAAARARQRTVRKGAQVNEPGQKPPGSQSKLWGAIQVVLFFGMVYLFVRSCGGSHM